MCKNFLHPEKNAANPVITGVATPGLPTPTAVKDNAVHTTKNQPGVGHRSMSLSHSVLKFFAGLATAALVV